MKVGDKACARAADRRIARRRHQAAVPAAAERRWHGRAASRPEGAYAPDAKLCTDQGRRRHHARGRLLSSLAGPPGAAGARAAAGRRADDHRPAHPRHVVPGGARRAGGDSRRLRHRQDRAAGDAGEMVRRRRHRLCRLRRARQRDGGSVARVSQAHRSAHRPRPDGAHRHHRQYLEHAGGRARGQHLHRGHGRRIFPRPRAACGADGGFDQPLGRGAARSLRPARRAARAKPPIRPISARGWPNSTSAPRG